MDDKSNVTYITIGGYVDISKYRFVYFFIIFALYILIILSNSTIVYLIWAHQDLHEPMYIFIAALSLNSMLFSTTIYPKFLIDFLSDKQVISYPACVFQYYMFYFLGTADFLLLAAMAFDRYVSICKPLSYHTIMGKKTISALLFLAWIAPACSTAVLAGISASRKLCNFTLRGIFCNNSILKLPCISSKIITIYGLIAMLNLAVLPIIFILSTYSKILLIAYRSNRDVRKKAAETCLPHLMVLLCFSLLCIYDIIAIRVEVDFPKVVHLMMSLQVVLYSPLLNPIIYGLKMTEISKHVKMLFYHMS